MTTALAQIIERQDAFEQALTGRSSGLVDRYRQGTMTEADIEGLRRDIDAQLSPENLHADGERPAHEVFKRARALRQAAHELHVLAQAMGEMPDPLGAASRSPGARDSDDLTPS